MSEVKSMEAMMESMIEKQNRKVTSIEKMPGDASTRKYYRVSTEKQAVQQTFVVMSMEPFSDQGKKVPFLSIQQHLVRNGVDVPRILDFDPEQGIILLEDLGDITLLRRLQEIKDFEQEAKHFEKAIDALVKMHTQTGPDHVLDKNELQAIEGFGQRFDVEKLMWEVNFTMEHFYLKHLQRNISQADLQVIQNGFTQICTELQAEKTVFTHRDYHSRNLMVTEDDRYVMIDFQDARMGPPQYDLASLLRDSYYQLSEKQIERLTTYYIKQMNAHGYKISDVARFQRLFDLMSVQRNFKAIGSFASFLNRRGNPAYLKFIGNTFENIRSNLMKYPEFQNLREVLYHYYYF